MTEAISKVQASTDKTAAELALKRLQEELRGLEYQKNILESSYYQQINEVRGGGFAIPTMLVILSLVGGAVLSFAYSSGIYLLYSLFAGASIGVITFGATSSSRKNELAAISTAMTRDVNQYTLMIRQTRQKIAKNRAIADS